MALADIFRAPWDAGDAGDAAFSDRALLSRMLAFEGALARALADADVVPHAAAEAAASLCEHWAQDGGRAVPALDPDALAVAARHAGTLAIPFVKALTEAVAAEDAQAARCIHRGATSQDVIDTALVLEARRVAEALVARLCDAGDAAAVLATTYRDTPVTGRTLLQAAVPVSFGWKAAGWLAGLHRCVERIERAVPQACSLQFGGAAGTLASLADRAQPVAQALARHLDLPLPATSWHGLRDGPASLAAEFGLACGVLGKIGGDIALLMQSEVAEAFEPAAEGRGGSSAMPHKRNPVGAMLAREAALRAPGLVATLMSGLPAEHERGLGHWQRDWFTWRDLAGAAASAADAVAEVLAGLRVDTVRMRANIDALQGFPFAEALAAQLADALGRPAAQSRVEALCRDALARGQTLQAAAARAAQAGEGGFDAARLAQVFDPARHLGGANAMTDAVLAQWHARRAGQGERRAG